MATATFDKRIVIGEEAADRLIAVLNAPTPPREDPVGIRWCTEEDDECFWQNRSAKLPAQTLKK